jgi:hypothetical protein
MSAVVKPEETEKSSKSEARVLLGCHARIQIHLFGSAKNIVQIPLVEAGDKEMTIEDLKEVLFNVLNNPGIFDFWKGGEMDELIAAREVKQLTNGRRRTKSWQASAPKLSEDVLQKSAPGMRKSPKAEPESDEEDMLAHSRVSLEGEPSDVESISKMLEQGPKFYMLRAFPADTKAVVDPKVFNNWLYDEEKTVAEYYALKRMGPAKNIVTRKLTPGCCFHLGLEPAFKMPQRQWFCKISQTRQVPDLNNKIYTQYVVEIKHGRLHWQVAKRYREFHKLNDTLKTRKLASTLSLLKVHV